MEVKVISPLISQLCLRNLGMYASERLSVDIYYLLETVNLLVHELGEDYIAKKYSEEGKDWNEIKVKLEKITKQIFKTKVFYDAIEDKKLSKGKKSTDVVIKRFFRKTASKVAIMQYELYSLFVFLVKISSIQRQTVPADAFKILEHRGFGKIELKRRPMEGVPEIVIEEEK